MYAIGDDIPAGKSVGDCKSYAYFKQEIKEQNISSLEKPFNIVEPDIRDVILKNVHAELERTNGIIRYVDDAYHNINGEAEWTIGNCFLYESYKINSIFTLNISLLKVYKSPALKEK